MSPRQTGLCFLKTRERSSYDLSSDAVVTYVAITIIIQKLINAESDVSLVFGKLILIL